MNGFFSQESIDKSLGYINDGTREIILKNESGYGFFVGMKVAGQNGLVFHRSYANLFDAKRKYRELVA